ncbi:hypothetical protein HK101_006674, partial [Irineochytrium annulatum]
AAPVANVGGGNNFGRLYWFVFTFNVGNAFVMLSKPLLNSYVCGLRGHLSKQCESAGPVWAPKACFRCQSVEHLSKDCPEKANAQAQDRANAVCFRCQNKGHFAKECPTKPPGPPPGAHQNVGGYGGNTYQQQQGRPQGQLICHKCGGAGHFAKECPSRLPMQGGGMMPQQQYGRPPMMQNNMRPPMMQQGGYNNGPQGQGGIICLRCGMTGHMARSCSNPQICWFCKKPGHVSKECPQSRRCFVCGDLGHQARDCDNQTAKQNGDYDRASDD